MTTPTTDAREREARVALLSHMALLDADAEPYFDAYRTAVRAALLAEVRARVEGMRVPKPNTIIFGGQTINAIYDEVLAALDAMEKE